LNTGDLKIGFELAERTKRKLHFYISLHTNLYRQLQNGGTHNRYVTRPRGRLGAFAEGNTITQPARLAKLMAWGWICGHCVGDLVFVNPAWGNERGNFNADAYVAHIVPHLRPMWQLIDRVYTDYLGVPLNTPNEQHHALVMQDNSAIHNAGISRTAVHQAGIPLLGPWPPLSPDLNPIENIWCELKRYVHQPNPRPRTLAEYEARATEYWQNLKVEDYVGNILGMPDRIQAVIAAEGGHTRY
jgi:DDE superfamily endonuclease